MTQRSGRSSTGPSCSRPRVNCSSGECASRLYAPGRSRRVIASGSWSWAQVQFSQSQVGVARVVRQTPRETSTVVPGQLPVVTRERVRALKSVDLPVLGAPTRATTGASIPAVCCGLVWQQALAEDATVVVD